MNKLLYQLSSDYHLSFKQKVLQICFQIFGHEALIDVTHLRNNSHCQVFDMDIYRLASIKNQLAYRKLFNPFKWIEWGSAIVLESIPWCFYNASLFLKNKLTHQNNAIIYFLGKTVQLILENLGFLLNIACHMLLGVARRFVAPVRYLVRPSLELLQIHPNTFLALLSLTLLMSAVLTFTFLTGGSLIPFLLGMAMIWTVPLKGITSFLEVNDAVSKIENRKPADQQEVKQFLAGSTYKLTELLHAVNPKVATVNHVEEQSIAFTLALFTGTELFYKPSTTKQKQVVSKNIAYSQLSLYQEYKSLHSFDSTTRHPDNFKSGVLYIQKLNDDIEYMTLTKMKGGIKERYHGVIAKTELLPETLTMLSQVLTPGSDQPLMLPYTLQKDLLTAYIQHRSLSEAQQKTTASLRP